MIKAVIFDMDGTLLDSEVIYRSCWMQAAQELSLHVDVDEFVRDVGGMVMGDISLYCEKKYGKDFPFEMWHARRSEILRRTLEMAAPPLKPGVPDIFPVLRGMGLRLALATSSGRRHAHETLTRVGILDAFDAVMTGDLVENGKPDPEIFIRAAERLNVPPSECVVAEDSANGVRAGYAAGMRTVMIPDLIPCTQELMPFLWARLDSLWELPERIEKEINIESEKSR